MRRVLLVGLLVLAGCGGEAATEDEPTTTTAAPTTTEVELTREEIGLAIADQADPTKMLGYMHTRPERIAEMAGRYCADLDTSDGETARDSLEESLSKYIWLHGGPGNKDTRMADVSAGLVAGSVADAATELLCPGAGSDKYLPPA